MIDFSFDKKQEALKAEILLLAQHKLNDGVIERDQNQEFDRLLWSKAGELQLGGLPVDEQYGGRGLDIISTIHALESIGYACRDNGLSFAIGAHLLACVIPVWLYGNNEQKQRLLPKLCSGQWIAANAMTESQGGSDAFNMQSKGEILEERYLLNGQKIYSSNAPIADIFLTYVLTNPKKGAMGGVSAFLLEKDQVEVSEPVNKMGLRSCLMGSIKFTDLKVSTSQMLGKEGGGLLIFSQSMIWERIGLSAMHLGTLQYLVEKAIQYTKQRKFGGTSISKFQSIAHRLTNIQTELTAARWLTYYAAWCLKNKKESNLYASMAKLKTSELYKKSCMELVQVMGTKGYINNSVFERNLRDATASTLYSGTSEIQHNIIGRWLNL